MNLHSGLNVFDLRGTEPIVFYSVLASHLLSLFVMSCVFNLIISFVPKPNFPIILAVTIRDTIGLTDLKYLSWLVLMVPL